MKETINIKFKSTCLAYSLIKEIDNQCSWENCLTKTENSIKKFKHYNKNKLFNNFFANLASRRQSGQLFKNF